MDFLKKITDAQWKLVIYVMSAILVIGFFIIPIFSLKGHGVTALAICQDDYLKASDFWWILFYIVAPAVAAYLAYASKKITEDLIPGILLIIPWLAQLIFCESGNGMIKMSALPYLSLIFGIVAIAFVILRKQAEPKA
jgi:hypothetical protein